MNDDLRRRIELEALVTEREGMLAGNQYRERRCEAQMYSVEHFDDLAGRMRALLEPEPSKHSDSDRRCADARTERDAANKRADAAFFNTSGALNEEQRQQCLDDAEAAERR